MMLNDLKAFYVTDKKFTKEFLKLILIQKEYRHLTNRFNKLEGYCKINKNSKNLFIINRLVLF